MAVSLISAAIAASVAIGTTVASTSDTAASEVEAKAMMEMNHKYATIAEKKEEAAQRAANEVGRELYTLGLADKKKAEKQQAKNTGAARGSASKDRMLNSLNNNPAIREQVLGLFGGNR